MDGRREVILVQQTNAMGREYAAPLPDLGFQVLVCNSVHGFRRVHHPRRVLATLLLGPSTHVVQTTAGLRRLDPRMWIAWVGGAANAAQRAQVLGAGADLCFAPDATPAEVSAGVRAMFLRNQRLGRFETTRAKLSERERLSAQTPGQGDRPERRSVPESSHRVTLTASLDKPARVATWASSLSRDLDTLPKWTLVDEGRRLRNPAGIEVPLTAAERLFVSQLLAARGAPIHRNRLSIQPSDSGDTVQRSADVMLSRLRRKCRRLGAEVPILAVRGWGYMMRSS